MFKISSLALSLLSLSSAEAKTTLNGPAHQHGLSYAELLQKYGPVLHSTSATPHQEHHQHKEKAIAAKELTPAQQKAKLLHEQNFYHEFVEKYSQPRNAPVIKLSEVRQLYSQKMKNSHKQEKKMKAMSHEELQAHFPAPSAASAAGNLRSLKSSPPNNFFTISFDMDDYTSCSTPDYSFGYLVNYCYVMNDGTSYLYKVNKKQNLLVELSYPNTHCDGVPDIILNENIEGTSAWGECVDGSMYTYYSEFPGATTFDYPMRGIVQTLEGDCMDGTYVSTSKVIGYDLNRATNCVQDTTSIWKNLDLTSCSVTGSFKVNYFINNQCTEAIAYQETYTVPTTCYPTYPTDDYPHPEGWTFQYYCSDPSGATTPPAPATPTCNYDSLYLFIGNGECEAEYNTEGCGYDGGDCCVETCNEFSANCPTDNTNCVDPAYAP
jgi:hypothetical protein